MSTISLAQLYRNARAVVYRPGGPPDVRDAPSRLRPVFDRVTDDITAQVASGAITEQSARQRTTLNELLRAVVMGALQAIRFPTTTPVQATPAAQQSSSRCELRGLLRFGRSNHHDNLPPPPVANLVPTVDLAGLGDGLQEAFDMADHLLALVAPPPPPVVVAPWSTDLELLELFQDLLEAQLLDDGGLALSHIERLRRALPLRHGVEVVAFDGSNAMLFQPGPGGDPADGVPRTVRPALVVDGRVVRKGETRISDVHEPAAAAPQPEPSAPDTPTTGQTGGCAGEEPDV